jgi:capsular polysaccharide biosynthesis protein
MSILSAEPTVVRQRPRRILFAVAALVVFAGVGSAAFAWKYRLLPPSTRSAGAPPTAPVLATAKVVIHDPTFAPQRAWQEILAQSKSEVRDHLASQSERCGDATVVSVSLSDLPRENLAPLVNVVASAFVQNCRSQWKVEAERAYSAAQEKLRETQRTAQEADSRAQSLRQRQAGSAATASPRMDAPSVVMVENPKWTDAARRLAELEERQRQLLFERTPLHPSVQELEMRIGDMRRELAAIPQKIAQSVSPLPSVPDPQAGTLVAPPAVTPVEIETAQQAAQAAQRQVRQAEAAAQAATTARNAELRIDLQPAEEVPEPPASGSSMAELLAMAVAAATTSVVGLGMISYGASLAPAVSTIGELQALLPVPILGVVPVTDSRGNPARSALGRRLIRCLALLMGLLLLGGVAWIFVHG